MVTAEKSTLTPVQYEDLADVPPRMAGGIHQSQPDAPTTMSTPTAQQGKLCLRG
jgi:hypothetical protein